MTQLPPPSRNAYLTMIRTAWAFAGDERPRMRRFYGLFLCANLILLAQPWALGQAINALQAGGPDLATEAAKWLGFNGLLMLGFWAFHGPARVVEMIFGFHNRRRFITALYRRVTDLPMAWHAEHHSGDTINRIRKAAEAVQAFSGEQFFYFETVIRFVGPIVVLAVIAWPLAVICLVLAVVIFWLLNRFDKVLIPLVHVENETDHAVTAGMFDYISNIATVLTLRLQEPTRAEMARRLMAAAGIIPRRAVLNEIKWFSMWMLVMLLEFLVLMAYIMMMIHSGKVEIGTLVAVLTYVRGLNEVFMRFAYAYADLVRQAAAVDSVRPILAAQPRVGADMPTLADWRRIEITDLSFAYEDEHHHRHSVASIALALARGERVALVGGSGGGKSTLAKLLRGLYQTAPGQGHVTVDGIRFPDLGPLDPLTTLAPQDPELFENTIRFNITLGADASAEHLARACDIAGFTPVLAELPKGLDTDIREKGVNLSGGQQQRLALARAVFAAAGSSLLLLDEPTSSLDPATEARVLTNLFTAFPEHTIVMALHRLHLLPRFDRVVVLEKGRIVEEGRFDALLAQGGALAAMWASYGEAMDEA